MNTHTPHIRRTLFDVKAPTAKNILNKNNIGKPIMKQREINNLKKNLEDMKLKNKQQRAKALELTAEKQRLSSKLFKLKVDQHQKDNSSSRKDAIKAIIKSDPALHKAYKTYKPAQPITERPPQQHAFFDEVDRFQKDKGLSRAAAVKAVIKADPALHKAYVEKRPGMPLQAKSNQHAFFDEVDRFQKDKSLSRAAAVKAAVKAFPDLHYQYKKGFYK